METFDINAILEYYNPNVEELSKMLFPHTKFPKQAFSRVVKGESQLNTEQIANLATYLGIVVSDLFKVSNWKGSSEDNCLTFTKGQYKVKLNYKGTYLIIYKGTTPIHKELTCTGPMTVESFINYINNLIKNNNGRN